MSIPRVASLLKEKMGLDAASIGTAAIERAVQQRLAACNCADGEAYWDHLYSSEVELQELIEAVVVPETWFLRDREAFAALTRIAHSKSSGSPSHEVLRVLSLPCATGEEPFSMAMALLDSGLPASRFQIDAIDISARAIAYAERAIYGNNSFRGTDVGFRERHFVRVSQGYQLGDAIRRQVRFRQANLFAPNAFPTSHLYDVIFCRNVLIYFDRLGRKQALRLLGRLLRPAGTLFVGPAETALLLDQGFVSARIPLAFAFRCAVPARAVADARPKAPPLWGPLAGVPPKGTTQPAAIFARESADSAALAVASPRAHGSSSPEWLEKAQQLADEGNLAEAMRHCQQHLREWPSAQAFYLVGVLHDAADEHEQARASYRRALYLDPAHHEALVHLAEALLREGATREAQILFDRAKRVQAGDDAA